MDLEIQKEHFKNHIATFTDYNNIKILDFKNPESSHYRIRFLFEEDYHRLHISGDLGHLIATNYKNMTFDGFKAFVNNTGYFEEKIDCHDRYIYRYNEDVAYKELETYFKENELLIFADEYSWCEDEDDRLHQILCDILEDFSDETGIGPKGYEIMDKLDENAFETIGYFGKESTGILDLYMLAFKLAMERLKKKEV